MVTEKISHREPKQQVVIAVLIFMSPNHPGKLVLTTVSLFSLKENFAFELFCKLQAMHRDLQRNISSELNPAIGYLLNLIYRGNGQKIPHHVL